MSIRRKAADEKDEAIGKIQAEHARELEKIDAKIRRLLDSKDRQIETMAQTLREAETSKKHLEASLADLNRKLM